MLKLLLCVTCVALTAGLKVMLENFEQVLGFENAVFNLRVRKFNRTTSVINGTVTMIIWSDNDIQISLDLFHSRLGNQQFNHYPMKLPTSGLCDFIDNIQDNYGEQLAPIENMPQKGDCPISPRTIYVRDYVFPTEVIPLVMPRGLWKAVVTGKRAGETVLSYNVLVKGYDDY